MGTYTIDISFAGYVDTDVQYTIEADSEEDAVEEALTRAADEELSVEDVVPTDDDEWSVTISFGGYLGAISEYVITADNSEDAVACALEEAREDLEYDVIYDDYSVSDAEITLATDINCEPVSFRDWVHNTYGEDFDPSGLSDEEFFELEDAYRADVPRECRERNYR